MLTFANELSFLASLGIVTHYIVTHHYLFSSSSCSFITNQILQNISSYVYLSF